MNSIHVLTDLRSQFGAARDQGERPTCLSFAMSDAHAAIRDADWEPLSCEYLFYHAKQRDFSPVASGTTLDAIRSALAEEGQPIEGAWPYQKALPPDLSSWTPPPATPILFTRNSTAGGQMFRDVWEHVESGRPVVLAMTLSSAFFTPNALGRVDVIEAKEPSMRHAVLATATGYSPDQRFLLVRNSWGEAWGLSGYAWLSERYAADKITATVTLL